MMFKRCLNNNKVKVKNNKQYLVCETLLSILDCKSLFLFDACFHAYLFIGSQFSQTEEGVVALHLPIEPLKPALDWSGCHLGWFCESRRQ